MRKKEVSKYVVTGLSTLSPISHRELLTAQQNDPGLQQLFEDVIPTQEVRSAASGYFMMR